MTSVLILLAGFDPGTYYIEDDGIAGNGIAQLRGPDGSVITFSIPTEFLTVTASAGRSIIFNLTESFGAADINVGSLTNSAENPDFIQISAIAGAGDVLMAANNSITEDFNDTAPDIIANTLILSAGTGVGTPGNALETQVGTIEAETNTGGINLVNYGSVVIGGLTNDAVGLDVETSGDLLFTSFGSIVLNEASPGGFESVHGGNTSGNVSLIANGFDSDITSSIDQDAIAAPGGDILLQAGRDISFGTLGANFDNDVRARGSLTLTAGRDVNLDGFADLASDGFGAATGGNVVVTAGRDINVLNSTGTDGSLGAEGSGGGDVFLTTGPGGFLRLLATSTATLFSSTGDVNVNADRIIISASSGITAGSGTITLAAASPGWNVILGSATDGAFAIELSDAELDRIFTPNLTIGSNNGGFVTISAAVSPASASNLVVRSGTNINVNASVTATGSLSLQALDNVFQLAASVITAPSLTVLVDLADDDPGVGGTATLNGTTSVTSNVIYGNLDADTLNGSSAANALVGLGGDDRLLGFGGNDQIDGGTGADAMAGGLGNDTFFVDNASDTVTEGVGEGNDSIFTTTTWIMAAGQEIEALLVNDAATTTPINLTGNAFGQIIAGNAGSNFLLGGGGADTLVGRTGDDNYRVDSLATLVFENPGEGFDIVFATTNWVMTPGAEVEALLAENAASTTAINLAGNAFGQIIAGNAGVNFLVGGGGADTLVGRGGDDLYRVDSPAAAVFENPGEGNDVVYATTNWVMTAGSEVEALFVDDAASTTAISLVGNAFAQIIAGNAGANFLVGGGGADTLVGRGGDDSYRVESTAAQVVENPGEGNDIVFTTVTWTMAVGQSIEALLVDDAMSTTAVDLTGNELSQIVAGNAGANRIDGRGGSDTLIGRGGADSFAFTASLGPSNVDTIFDYQVGIDRIELDDAVFTGLALGALNPNAFRSGAAAQDADDRIIYNPATGALLFDADGNGAGAAVQFAVATTGLAISANDFLVI